MIWVSGERLEFCSERGRRKFWTEMAKTKRSNKKHELWKIRPGSSQAILADCATKPGESWMSTDMTMAGTTMIFSKCHFLKFHTLQEICDDTKDILRANVA